MSAAVGGARSSHTHVNGVELHIVEAGEGPALVLLHGWPHTWRVWEPVLPRLAREHHVLALDLRGLGNSGRTAERFDAAAVAEDVSGVLATRNVDTAAVMALDASVPAAFLLAMRHPERVRRLVLMESLLLPLPGAEEFLAAGPPWWFGFHAVPGLAETVLVGHEDTYVGWFLDAGTVRPPGIGPVLRRAFVDAYTGASALRYGFEYYRVGAVNARLIEEATESGRLTVPTMAVGGNAVGDALYRQLSGVADDLVGHVVPDCGHIVPLDAPDALLDLVVPFLRDEARGTRPEPGRWG